MSDQRADDPILAECVKAIEHTPTMPKRAFRIEIVAQGDTWEDAAWALREAASEVAVHGPACALVSGGYSQSAYVRIDHNQEMTHDRYFEEVAVWQRHLE